MSGHHTWLPEEHRTRHGVLRVLRIVAAILAGVAWLLVALIVLMYVGARNAPEGMTGLVIAFVMPFVLVPALGFTAIAAAFDRALRGTTGSLVIAVVAAVTGVVVLFAWEPLIDLLP